MWLQEWKSAATLLFHKDTLTYEDQKKITQELIKYKAFLLDRVFVRLIV